MLAAPRSIQVAQLAFIGDMVFSTPLLDELKRIWPAARVTVIGKPAALAPLVDQPSVDATISYDKQGRDRGWSGFVRVARAARAGQPDLFIGVSRSLRTALLARMSGARIRVGFREPGHAAFYSVRAERRDDAIPFPERPLELLRALGVEAVPRPLHLEVSPARRANAKLRLESAGWRGEPLLAIAPGANYATKRWPAAHYGALLDRLAAAQSWRPALYGGPGEAELIDGILEGRDGFVLDRRGLRIEDMAAEFALAGIFLAGDSGPAHIARALRIPVVAIFGPTSPGPVQDGMPFVVLSRGLLCQPCSPHGDAICPLVHHRCMTEISPSDVLEALAKATRRAASAH